MAQNLSNNTTKKHGLMVFMILDRELNAYYTRLVHAVVSNISKYERPCLTTFPNTEKRVENTTRSGAFVFGNVVKHGIECVIHLLNRN